jgi:Sulfotransferase family
MPAGRYPDFFIAGAPRSGTTFMFEYLGQHPGVFAPERKEPQHFATDLDSGSYLDSLTFVRDTDEYLGLFAGARADQLTGEGSTWYLYSSDAAANIKRANPDARIIAMLRHPVEMLYSLHGRRFYAGSEDLPDFADALDAESDRRAGRRIPPRARNVKALFYRDVGKYGEQLERYFDTFGRDRVHVVIFDDFTADPAAAYRGVVEFLGLDRSFEPDFKVVNEAATRRSPRLQRMLLAPPVVRVARAVIPVGLRPRVGRAWDRLTTRKERRPPLDPQVASALRDDLLPDVQRLSGLLGRDMTKVWR